MMRHQFLWMDNANSRPLSLPSRWLGKIKPASHRSRPNSRSDKTSIIEKPTSAKHTLAISSIPLQQAKALRRTKSWTVNPPVTRVDRLEERRQLADDPLLLDLRQPVPECMLLDPFCHLAVPHWLPVHTAGHHDLRARKVVRAALHGVGP